MSIYIGTKKSKLFLGDNKIKKIYVGTEKVYSSGNIVTYYVDSNTSYTEEVDSEASCLSPKTFTPAISGWTFVGWREDSTASRDVLSKKVMGDEPITLYAVFSQNITVTYYNGSTTASSTSGKRYYNNGNVANPSFTLTQKALSGWTARGWSTGTAGNSGITYNNGATFTRDSSVTLYGMWYQTISLSYNGNGASSGSVATQYGNIYLSPGFSQVNPTFTLSANGFARTSCSFTKWALGSAGGTQYAAGAAVTLSTSSVCYALWTVSALTISMLSTNVYQMAIYPNDINAVRISNGIDASLYSGATLALGEVSGSENWAYCWFTAGFMSSTSTTVHSSSPGTARVHIARYDDENTVKYYENTNVTINFAETSGTVYLFAGVTGYKTSDEDGGGYGSWGFKFTSSAITLIPRF